MRVSPYAVGAVGGYVVDLVVGDPAGPGHPVAVFGRAAAAVERRLWRDRRDAGALYAALCVGGAVGATGLAAKAAAPGRQLRRRQPRPRAVAPAALAAGVTWSVLGGASLRREALRIADALAADDIARARELLPRLCGRDPQALSAQEIARAVVESVAENTSDAVVGALVWGAVAGVPGLAGFRAVNTLDAMVGHRSPRYARFGWAAARLDDVVGWPGSRLTALLAVAAGADPRGARRAWRRDGGAHPSPNAGPVEAAFAGALGVRLGGPLAYGGRAEARPVLNHGGRAVDVCDIGRAVALSRRVCHLALVATVAAHTLLHHRKVPR
ncbi:cobalamin biosynthesis protein [Streptomyces sp. A7024]|uniref:Cobalamin biosynthesis protein CobD n=1 Tax=Streptomyces coryli TaxID=1128680 RepID=A0A6G4U4G3_9ACTN|nr:cobalamin biosynthesis protein [Streptomyces coryli]NGN66606.1 cobalamin biosynthesis protein [Streptomyces coryli]